MPLDPSIIMGIKPLEMPDFAKIQSDAQTNQLNQIKMQEAQQGIQTKNALRQLDPNSPTYGSDVMRLDPDTGIKYGAYEAQQAKMRLDKMQAARDANANLVFNSSDENVKAHIQDALLRKDISYDQAVESLD